MLFEFDILHHVNNDKYPCAYTQPFEFQMALDGYANVERSKALLGH